ncbi:hypothetical protein phiAS5_ORF0087 [Aeromonas phage phiAS5]|uniref:Uncharacterized protein n=1 Tax=Aeromonas phage phiAS5 TaxID=879630 RepID=E1A2I4_9CAUD|nr:hypothetical protein phiAS5_ORF0087 [Aeromonas phage phiAS5]ADM79930.1 hypothetical protein phiAS5_ORF0087 [Aeromonas phage phiAS5]BES53299.1 hypothetical protein [Aeromonas phage phiWae14]
MFYLILIVPLLVPFIYKFWFKRTYTYGEMAANAAIAVALTGLVYGMGAYRAMYDTEILSGYVTSKERTWVSCSHSYDCRCRQVRTCSGSGKNRSCSTTRQCDTCYEHSNDWDWDVHTTVGNFEIDRIDRRGTLEPPRFSKVVIGDPAAREHGYTNYIKAAPDSLFAHDKNLIEAYKNKIPKYPEVYDYYNVNRVINLTGANTKDWNMYLSEALKSLGKDKQLNIIAVLTNEPLEFSQALFYNWAGGKKNDVVMAFGIEKGTNKVAWFQSTSLGNGMGNQELHITLRNESVDKEISLDLLKQNVSIIANKYNRLPMEQFEYLKDQSEPPLWVVILALVMGIGSSIAVGYFFSRD